MNPQLWRLEAARRRRQLEELQTYLLRMEAEFQDLERQVLSFQAAYRQQLGAAWKEVEQLQGDLLHILEELSRAQGLESPAVPPQRKHQTLPQLPPAVAWPTPPPFESELIAPSLKDLHRRAAMRLHPDRATDPEDRIRREALMRDANLAYADHDRATLEALLIASGESPQRLGGFDVRAHWQWLERCEHLAQGRMRILRAHLVALRQHPVTILAEHVDRARGRGLDALAVMHSVLRLQVQELTQQLYIARRIPARSTLAIEFIAQWQRRWGQEPRHTPEAEQSTSA
ncbi:hypothetical protein I7X43_09770 [Inhella sp. 4Y17]|uniref:J domain-containing protein n=2 Tax=Inhella gelatinilytica TaxID=2795030 RepID=A0A931J060_9BURK|nr:hypothetical protein [Inhella gelatinilytica]